GRLEGVLGVLRVAEQALAHVQDHRPMPAHQGFKGSFVPPGDEALQQLPVRHPAAIPHKGGPAKAPSMSVTVYPVRQFTPLEPCRRGPPTPTASCRPAMSPACASPAFFLRRPGPLAQPGGAGRRRKNLSKSPCLTRPPLQRFRRRRDWVRATRTTVYPWGT